MRINGSHFGFSGRQSDGFTLIELLVVISIIAMLLAVLLPTLRRVREIAKRVTCQTQLRQAAVAWNMYLDNFKQRFYQGQNANHNYGGWRGIEGQTPSPQWPAGRPLNGYVDLPDELLTDEQSQIFHCPADRGGYRPFLVYEKVYRAVGTSYQTNIFLIGQNSCGAFSSWTAELDQKISVSLKKMTLYRAGDPSRLLLIGDYGWVNQWKPRKDPYPEWKALAEWHGKEDWHNLSFLDGHVSFMEVQKGIYVDDEYCVLPFKALYGLAYRVQGPEP